MEKGYDIIFEHVTFSYPDGHCALRDLSLRVPAGCLATVLGANGSGKSTLARHVNGLLVPSEGSVRVGGANTGNPQELATLRRGVGMVFQNPDNQSVASIVRDDVAFGPENLGLPPGEIEERVDEALGRVGMSAHADAQVHELSGGQKQLVAIAGALAMRPKVLVLDEPGAMLDVRGRTRLLRLVHTLNATGMTIVLVTHFMEDALDAGLVAVLDHGTLALSGNPQDVFSQVDRIRALRLEPPFGHELAFRLAACGLELSQSCTQGELADRITAAVEKHANAGGVAGGQPPRPAAPRVVEDRDDTIVSFEQVSYTYGGSQENALRNLTLQLPAGAFCGLVGHTGSGKTTLAQLVDALLVPDGGSVRVGGHDTSQRKARRAVRTRVGIAFQYPEQQLFAASVAEDLAFGPRNLGLDEREIEKRARRALERVGLEYDELAQRSPFRLSGGQQRRVALAGILAMEPELLVLDEPCAGMDPASARELLQQLRVLNAEGTGILLISHSMDDVAALCERVIVLDQGEILLQGSAREVFSADNAATLERAGLGLPRPAQVALELRERGVQIPELPLTMSSLVDALCPKGAGDGTRQSPVDGGR